MSFAGFGVALSNLLSGTADQMVAAKKQAQNDWLFQQQQARMSPEAVAAAAQAMDITPQEAQVMLQNPALSPYIAQKNRPDSRDYKPLEFILNGKPVQGSFDAAGNQYYYNGQPVSGSVMPIPKSAATDQMGLYRNVEATKGLFDAARKDLPQPHKAWAAAPTTGFVRDAQGRNTGTPIKDYNLPQGIADSTAYANTILAPARARYQAAVSAMPGMTPMPMSAGAPTPQGAGAKVPFATRAQQLKAQGMSKAAAAAQLTSEGYDVMTGR